MKHGKQRLGCMSLLYDIRTSFRRDNSNLIPHDPYLFIRLGDVFVIYVIFTHCLSLCGYQNEITDRPCMQMVDSMERISCARGFVPTAHPENSKGRRVHRYLMSRYTVCYARDAIGKS